VQRPPWCWFSARTNENLPPLRSGEIATNGSIFFVLMQSFASWIQFTAAPKQIAFKTSTSKEPLVAMTFQPARAWVAVFAAVCSPHVWGQDRLTVGIWSHATGAEGDAYRQTIDVFIQQNPSIRVELRQIPANTFAKQVDAAASTKGLPCIIDMDGPEVYQRAWSKQIIPLDGFPELGSLKADLLTPVLRQGTYQGQLYSLGQYDSGLAIWGNKTLLDKAGVRIPMSTKDRWERVEFESALKKLKDSGVATPLDMKFNYGAGEWFTYGFSPLIQSFGGDLIDRKSLRSSTGVINGAAATEAMRMLQSWVKLGFVNPDVKVDDDFISGKSALSYVGHWTYTDYKKALGAELVLLPMPAFGGRAVTGAGSWSWGITADCKHPQAAAKLLAHLMSREEILRVTDINGAMPGTNAALARSRNYNVKGDLRVYVQQSRQNVSQVRPETPAYSVISAAFAHAVSRIVHGADVKTELDKAAQKIDGALEKLERVGK
jgi:multiple sugar transport system substrate-binding protein